MRLAKIYHTHLRGCLPCVCPIFVAYTEHETVFPPIFDHHSVSIAYIYDSGSVPFSSFLSIAASQNNLVVLAIATLHSYLAHTIPHMATLHGVKRISDSVYMWY